MKREGVRHVNQGVTEYYELRALGWIIVHEQEYDNWKINSFEYKELRHNQEPRNGLYGRVIQG